MIDSGSTRKYLLYAIGEIALVVFGILIALQINNWNEEKKTRQIEYVTLSELKKNVKANITEIDLISKDVNQRIVSINVLLTSLAENIPYHDSLTYHFGWAMVYDRMSMHLGAYESFKASGSQVVKDEILRFEISNYFDHSLGQLENYMIEVRDDFYNYMLGYLRQEFIIYKAAEHIGVPKDYDALKQNESFILSLGIFLDVQNDAFNSLIKTKKKSNDVLEKINLRISKIGLTD